MGYLQQSAKKTFWQRFRSVALFWGLPLLCLELIGLPWQGIELVLLIEIPLTVLAVLTYTLMKIGIVKVLRPYVSEPQSKPPQ